MKDTMVYLDASEGECLDCLPIFSIVQKAINKTEVKINVDCAHLNNIK